MESVIINPRKKSDLKLLVELARKMGCSSRIIEDEEKEELGLLKAMEEGKKTRIVSRSLVMKKLNKKGGL